MVKFKIFRISLLVLFGTLTVSAVFAASSIFRVDVGNLFLDDKLSVLRNLDVNQGRFLIGSDQAGVLQLAGENGEYLNFGISNEIEPQFIISEDGSGVQLLGISADAKRASIPNSLSASSGGLRMHFDQNNFVFSAQTSDNLIFDNRGSDDTAGGFIYRSGSGGNQKDLMTIDKDGNVELGDGVVLNTNGNGLTNLRWGNFTGNPVGGRIVCPEDGESYEIGSAPCYSTWAGQWNDGDNNPTLEAIAAGFGVSKSGNEFSLQFDDIISPLFDAFGSTSSLLIDVPALANHHVGRKVYNSSGLFQGLDLVGALDANEEETKILNQVITTHQQQNWTNVGGSASLNCTQSFVDQGLNVTGFLCAVQNTGAEFDRGGATANIFFKCCAVRMSAPTP